MESANKAPEAIKSRGSILQRLIYSNTKVYVQAALLLSATFSLYSGSLHFPFVFDDIEFFENTQLLAAFGHSLFSLNLRWLPYATFGWTVNWFGLDLFWLRLGNILLHSANSIILFFFLRRLFYATLISNDTSSERKPSLDWFAFFGALLFALHPISVYGVTYLIERPILMANMFILLMLLIYLEGLLRERWYWMLAAVPFYFAAILSKEHSIAALGVVLVLTLVIKKPSLAMFRKIAPLFIMLAIIAFYLFFRVKGILGHAYEPNAAGILDLSAKKQGLMELPNAHLLSILTQSTLFFKYLGLWLLPNPAWMSVDMREAFAMAFLSWPYTLGLLAFLIYPCFAVWLLIKRGSPGLLGFAMLFPWILFLTEFSTVRIQEPFVLYRSYLWMPGLFASLPVVFKWTTCKRGFILLSVTSLLFIPLSMNRLDTFSSPLQLWNDAEKLVHNKSGAFGIERIYYNRGTELGQLKRYNEAIADFNKAIAIYPFDFEYGNRATAYFFLGKYQEALRDFNLALSLDPDNANSYYGRAMTYRALGDFTAAAADTQKSCSLGLCPPM